MCVNLPTALSTDVFSVPRVNLCKMSVYLCIWCTAEGLTSSEKNQRALRDTCASLTEQPEPRKPLPQTGSSGAQQLYRTSLSTKQTLRHHILPLWPECQGQTN